MKILFLIIITTITFSCGKQKGDNFDFVKETGITEDEYYAFLINDYSKRLDTLSSNGIRTLYSFAAPPIKIEYENGAPTTVEPPGVDFKAIKTYRLDQNRLNAFNLISADVYSKAQKGIRNEECKEFNENIGAYIVFLHLPWYNPKDSSLLMKEYWATCPARYHESAGVFGRYKKRGNNWTLDFD